MRPVARRAWSATAHFRPVLVLVILMFVLFSILQHGFFQWANLENMLAGVAVLWVVSMGMTYVTIIGGIDLSVGASAALIGIFIGKMLESVGLPGGLTVVLSLLMGAGIGAGINGLLIGRAGLSFFVVTLASMTALTGVVNLWSNTKTQMIINPVISRIGVEHTAGLPTPIWIMIAIFLVALYVQQRTFFGRDIYAVGGSVTAARLSGIRTTRTIVIVYGIVGACAALSGVIADGQIGAASPDINVDLPLQAAAAVLIGGTALTGGSGGVGGTALGVLFIGILQNGLDIAGLQSFWQQVVTGVILVAAVAGDQLIGDNGRALRATLAEKLPRQRVDQQALVGTATER